MSIAILQEMVKGSSAGSLDADLIKTNDSHFSVNANKQLELHLDYRASNSDIPTTGGSTTTAPAQAAVRRAIAQLGGYVRTELAYGDHTVPTNGATYPTTDAQITERIMFPDATYDISQWHELEIYVSSNANTPRRIFLVQRITPGLIPTAVHTNGPTWQWSLNWFNNQTWVYDENANANHIRFAQSGNKLVMMEVLIAESGTLFEGHSSAPQRTLHCGIYGIRYPTQPS